jgi:hypothetical protein
MDSNGEMIQKIMEEEQNFDINVREHLSIISCLPKMLDGAKKRKKGRAVKVQSLEERSPSRNRGWRDIPSSITSTSPTRQHKPIIFVGAIG